MKIKMVIILLFCTVCSVLASQATKAKASHGCPNSVKCDLDGQYMSQEETYWNGLHESAKYGHDYYGPNGKVHHYVIVSCD
jgi:hypothetical protein